MTKIEFFQNLTQIEIFSTIWPKSNFSKIWLFKTEIFRNFFEYFDENRKFSKISPKSKFFEKLTNIKLFRKFDQNRDSKFSNKSKFFENFDQNRNFSKISTKSKFFEILTKIQFFENLTQIEMFRKHRNFL